MKDMVFYQAPGARTGDVIPKYIYYRDIGLLDDMPETYAEANAMAMTQ